MIDIQMSKAGLVRYGDTEGVWTCSDHLHPDTLQRAIFAGEQMLAYGTEDDDDDGNLLVFAPFTLSYFGFKAEFASMADAKEHAREFAKAVLQQMQDMV